MIPGIYYFLIESVISGLFSPLIISVIANVQFLPVIVCFTSLLLLLSRNLRDCGLS